MSSLKEGRELLAIVVQHGEAVPIYIDQTAADFAGVRRVAMSVANDLHLVTDVKPELVTDRAKLGQTAIIAGTIGQNDIIDSLITEGRLDVSGVERRRECFIIRIMENPCPELDTGIIIAGSEKRGTFYGLYHLSRLAGVSPWVYWADVYPQKRAELVFTAEQLEVVSKEPSIRYRGFFINDEWPSFGSWTTEHFGGFNELMYEKVFELILRLKGNYLWPAMWSAVFSEDGSKYPLANAELAEEYGIVMGTSHHEPMCRAGEEWKKVNSMYGDNGIWDYWANTEAITKFWEDGIHRNKQLSNIITLGMRGEQDSALGGTLEQNIQRLKDIILTQKDLLRKAGLEHVPQALTIYKEVEAFWYGTNDVQGLKDWDVLDDVTIIMSDDNFGNMRKLPEESERDRAAGWGIYYHFDYHGGPISYEWVNTVPLEKVWEQMSLAYDYGIRDIWVVNVGDLKPMELPLSYFMELAYDFEAWGTANPNRTSAFLHDWVQQQFGYAVSEEAVSGIAEVLHQYTRMNGRRKPEVTYADTYSLTYYNEGQRVLAEALELERQAQLYGAETGEALRDAYDQLVYYPAAASANVKKMQIYAGLNQKYSQMKPSSALANHYARLTEQAIAKDIQMQEDYNLKLSGGKWKGMMSSAHIGYVHWNDEGWTYPKFTYTELQEQAQMLVEVEGAEDGLTSGSLRLPPFTNLQKERYRITVSNAGKQMLNYHLETSGAWIKTSKLQGSVLEGEDLWIELDWEQVDAPMTGDITLIHEDQVVRIAVEAQVIHPEELPAMTFVETHDVIAIEAEHFYTHYAPYPAHFEVIERYGRSLSSVKLFPTTASYAAPEEAPYLEYRVFVAGDGVYTLTAYSAPTNPLAEEARLAYAIAVDEGRPLRADMLPRDFAAGESFHWSEAVLNNAHVHATSHALAAGSHTLRFYVMDAALVLQRLVLSKGPLPYTYFGPPESFCTRPKQGEA